MTRNLLAKTFSSLSKQTCSSEFEKSIKECLIVTHSVSKEKEKPIMRSLISNSVIIAWYSAPHSLVQQPLPFFPLSHGWDNSMVYIKYITCWVTTALMPLFNLLVFKQWGVSERCLYWCLNFSFPFFKMYSQRGNCPLWSSGCQSDGCVKRNFCQLSM